MKEVNETGNINNLPPKDIKLVKSGLASKNPDQKRASDE